MIAIIIIFIVLSIILLIAWVRKSSAKKLKKGNLRSLQHGHGSVPSFSISRKVKRKYKGAWIELSQDWDSLVKDGDDVFQKK